MNKSFFLFLIIATACIGCSSDDDTIDLTPAEKIVGVWEGEYLQEDFGSATINVTITELLVDQIVGRPAYGANDKSVCNNTFFFCDEPTQPCTAVWVFTSSSSTTFMFNEIEPSNIDCAEGEVTLRLTDDNTMSYRWVDFNDSSNVSNGTLRRS